MENKKCFKCFEIKPLNDFYKHSQMADGHLNKCKDCNKKDVQENYQNKRQQYAEYERDRFQRPERKASVLEYQRRRRATNPIKDRARQAVNNAIRDGRLDRQPCVKCGARAEAHHPDYSKPLEVEWLCFQHHREAHGQTVNTPTFRSR